jgi:hypothetical protein
MHVQAEQFCDPSVAAPTQAQRFEPCEQPALLFIERTVEEQKRCPNFIEGLCFAGGTGMERRRRGDRRFSMQFLVAAPVSVGGQIKVKTAEFVAYQTVTLDQLQQCVLDWDTKLPGQLRCPVPLLGARDHLGRSVQKLLFRQPWHGADAGRPLINERDPRPPA